MVSNSLSILEDLYLSEIFHLGTCASQFEIESSNFVLNGLIRESTFTDEKRKKVFSTTKADDAKFGADDRLDYGRGEIKKLIHHYENLQLDESGTLNEWEEFKRFVLFDLARKPDCESSWADSAIQCSSKAEVYPNLSKLTKALLVMNVQNASVERGFG
uniref:HAT C-terminal dimerisation domain-containing protein n=1 Tax=Romanomermis culicivorax TaxID=13658 RepID=A0A915ICK8_ROMCU